MATSQLPPDHCKELGGPEIKRMDTDYPQKLPYGRRKDDIPGLTEAPPAGAGINPKDAIGAKKPDLSLNPPAALVYMAVAMANGKKKYGRANYRESKILGTVYAAAAMRHIQAWLDGEEFSDDTDPPVPHLAHNLASIGILIDAIENGNFIDDRPRPGSFGATLNKFTVK